MTSRRHIKGVLWNFLGTFTSRYSDFDGYWVFGFLFENLDGMKIDLLTTSIGNTSAMPSDFARQLALQKFAEQIAKAGLPRIWFREAYLEISKSSEPVFGVVNGLGTSGSNIRFLARAVTDLGRAYEATVSIFVAPHDPKVELRSARATEHDHR